jgi:hypothetical protein
VGLGVDGVAGVGQCRPETWGIAPPRKQQLIGDEEEEQAFGFGHGAAPASGRGSGVVR